MCPEARLGKDAEAGLEAARVKEAAIASPVPVVLIVAAVIIAAAVAGGPAPVFGLFRSFGRSLAVVWAVFLAPSAPQRQSPVQGTVQASSSASLSSPSSPFSLIATSPRGSPVSLRTA